MYESPERLVRMQGLLQLVGGGAWDSSFPTNPQVLLWKFKDHVWHSEVVKHCGSRVRQPGFQRHFSTNFVTLVKLANLSSPQCSYLLIGVLIIESTREGYCKD